MYHKDIIVAEEEKLDKKVIKRRGSMVKKLKKTGRARYMMIEPEEKIAAGLLSNDLKAIHYGRMVTCRVIDRMFQPSPYSEDLISKSQARRERRGSMSPPKMQRKEIGRALMWKYPGHELTKEMLELMAIDWSYVSEHFVMLFTCKEDRGVVLCELLVSGYSLLSIKMWRLRQDKWFKRIVNLVILFAAVMAGLETL
jgi:hypothetical protein